MSDLRKQRNFADYDLKMKQVEEETAETIIKNLDGCKDQRLKSVMEAIKAYAILARIELR